MEAHCEDFRWFVDEDQEWSSYLVGMKQNGTWGGNIELQAASLALHVNILVHQCDETVPRMWVRNWGSSPSGAQPRTVHLAYHGSEHYNSVRLCSDIVDSAPATLFDFDRLVETGGSDIGEVSAVDDSKQEALAAVSASAKSAVCPNVAHLHADALQAAADPHCSADIHSAAVSKLLKNTADFPGRSRMYVAFFFERLNSDYKLAVDCLTEVSEESLRSGHLDNSLGAESCLAACGIKSKSIPRLESRKLSNKERRALRKAAKYEQLVASTNLGAAGSGGGACAASAAIESATKPIQAAALASLQKGSGKQVSSTYQIKGVDI
jgi:hypothetical protein